MEFEDILYEVRNGVAWITINRADKMNAFRGQTCDEIIKALNKAGYDKSVGCIVLAGAGEKAFCTGGDQSAHDGNYDGRGTIGLPMEELHTAIRDVPKPVIARVQGFAIGGGNVLCTICDLTICSEKAIFGQVNVRGGEIMLKGEDITGLKADRLVTKGVGMVPQNNNVFPSLTIEENLEMGLFQDPRRFKERFEFVAGLFPELAKRRKQRAGSLSGGQRKLLLDQVFGLFFMASEGCKQEIDVAVLEVVG